MDKPCKGDTPAQPRAQALGKSLNHIYEPQRGGTIKTRPLGGLKKDKFLLVLLWGFAECGNSKALRLKAQGVYSCKWLSLNVDNNAASAVLCNSLRKRGQRRTYVRPLPSLNLWKHSSCLLETVVRSPKWQDYLPFGEILQNAVIARHWDWGRREFTLVNDQARMSIITQRVPYYAMISSSYCP